LPPPRCPRGGGGGKPRPAADPCRGRQPPQRLPRWGPPPPAASAARPGTPLTLTAAAAAAVATLTGEGGPGVPPPGWSRAPAARGSEASPAGWLSARRLEQSNTVSAVNGPELGSGAHTGDSRERLRTPSKNGEPRRRVGTLAQPTAMDGPNATQKDSYHHIRSKHSASKTKKNSHQAGGKEKGPGCCPKNATRRWACGGPRVTLTASCGG